MRLAAYISWLSAETQQLLFGVVFYVAHDCVDE